MYDLMYGNSTAVIRKSNMDGTETEEQKARGIVKPNTGTTSEERVKPNTGTPSDCTKPNTGVSPSPETNDEIILEEQITTSTSPVDDTTSQEEHPSNLGEHSSSNSSSLEEDPNWRRLSRADNMRKVS